MPRIILLALSFILAPAITLADAYQNAYYQNPQEFFKQNVELKIGVGVATLPKFEGSSDYEIIPLPIIEANYGGIFFLDSFRGLGMNVYNQDGLRIGPILTFSRGREQNDASYLRGTGDVDWAFETGVFLEYQWQDWTFGWDLRSDTLNTGHKGAISDINATYFKPFMEKFQFVGGVNLGWGSEDYMQSFFSINAFQSFNSGLAQYTADSGFKDIGANMNVIYLIDDTRSLSFMFNVKELFGDAADSPVVKAGSSTQYFGGAAFVYKF